jgi:AraC-like DNA-binding protein
MGLIASLPEIDKQPRAVFVMHEKSEKLIPLHTHTKGQLSYVQGGVAYITIDYKTYVVPARHFFWIPQGVPHILRIAYSATVLRSLYFYSYNDKNDPFYSKLGIYPTNELLIQMISYTERWDGRNISSKDENFEFLSALKNVLPTMRTKALPIVLPVTDDERVLKILKYLDRNLDQIINLKSVSNKFNISERSLSRLFQSSLNTSFLQYLKTLRIVKALEMILKTKKTISEIANDVGYETLGAFSNTFYSLTNSRPSDLRKDIKGQR